MKSRPFAIDPWLPFVAVFVLMYMVIPLLMMWIGLNQGYNLDAVTTASRVTMYSLSFASVVVFMVFVAFRGTAIHHAARSGQIRHLEQMIEKGRPIDTRTLLKRTPLHFACKADRRAAVIYLLEHGADPQARDLFGYTPRDFAKTESVIEFLDEFQYEKQKEPRRVAITAASTLARGHQGHDEKFSKSSGRKIRIRYISFNFLFVMVCVAVSAYPIWLVALWLAVELNIPHGVPVKEQANGWLWSVLVMLEAATIVVVCYGVLGLLWSIIVGWPKEYYVNIFWKGKLPSHWFEE